MIGAFATTADETLESPRRLVKQDHFDEDTKDTTATSDNTDNEVQNDNLENSQSKSEKNDEDKLEGVDHQNESVVEEREDKGVPNTMNIDDLDAQVQINNKS